jgi:hypothetical protein
MTLNSFIFKIAQRTVCLSNSTLKTDARKSGNRLASFECENQQKKIQDFSQPLWDADCRTGL